MFRHILAILLINTCYHSLGNPVPRHNISSALSLLEIHCENPFLNNLIKSKIKECSSTVPPFSEKQFQCLIFYDMSNQLCSAVSTSQLALNEDYSAKINEDQDVNSLCETAKDWEFGNLSEFVVYKAALDKVFKHPVTCGKVCGPEELTSSDVNFFCKFFNWGLGIMKTIGVTSQKSTNVTFSASDINAVALDTNKEVLEQNNEPLDIPIKNINKSKVTEPSPASVAEKVSVPSDIHGKPDTVSTSTNMEVSSSVGAPNTENNDASKLVEKEVGESPLAAKIDKVEVSSGGDQNNEITKLTENEVVNDPSAAKEEKVVVNNDLDHKETEPEAAKKSPQSDGLDYPDNDLESDEGRDGLLDTQGGDDGDDPMISDNKPQEQGKANEHKEPSLSSFNREISQGDYYHTVQDGYSDGDDDHFFTFFLTAVVMAILLYVLYHNKNKVSKVFFGLLLEGRQSGRRRNSRGHAYRRLDTLEQAMNTNTAAPPSKIIY